MQDALISEVDDPLAVARVLDRGPLDPVPAFPALVPTIVPLHDRETGGAGRLRGGVEVGHGESVARGRNRAHFGHMATNV